ncbi:HNH endonuclease [Undibacterium terreum]
MPQESCLTALEAAHIIPSNGNGNEVVENGILLRVAQQDWP